MSEFRKSLLLLIGSTLLWLAIAEGICQLLPVHTGFEVQPVDVENPVIRFHPNRDFLFSHGPFLTNVNRGHVNNYGFVNDQDYETRDKRPLLAVIGDSYVEAGMVPYPLTLQGRLAGRQNGSRRVYSFGSSGSFDISVGSKTGPPSMPEVPAVVSLTFVKARQTSAACSPTPWRVTSSRAIAVNRSSSSSMACKPSTWSLPSIAKETRSFFPISRRQLSCAVSE